MGEGDQLNLQSMGRTIYHEQYIPTQQNPLRLLQQLIEAGLLSHYFLYQTDQDVRIAGNPLITIAVNAEAVIMNEGDQNQTQLVCDPLKQVESMFSTVSLENWTAYGYISFDFSGFYYPYSKQVINQPLLHFFVPKTELHIRPDGIYLKTIESVENFLEILAQKPPALNGFTQQLQIKELPKTQHYIAQVNQLKNAIHQGKLHKAILSRSVQFQQELEILKTYQIGIQNNHAYRSYCLQFDDFRAVGFSPETLLEIQSNGQILTNPLAGTRPRSPDSVEDARLRQQLFTEAKEVKEHALSIWHVQQEMTLVCNPETIKIQDFMQIKKYRYVQHLSSRIMGQLQPNKTLWDALKVLFPAVTVSGIEKHQAIEWIDLLEEEPRGLYAGAVGWINSQGQADLAIPIRSAYQYADRVYLNAGAGIMAESIPEQEALECFNKMNTMLQSLVLKT